MQPNPITLESLSAQLNALAARLDAGAPGYLAVDAAAAYCSVSEKTIRRAISRGDLTATRPARGLVRVSRREIDEWLAKTAPVRLRRGRGIRSNTNGKGEVWSEQGLADALDKHVQAASC